MMSMAHLWISIWSIQMDVDVVVGTKVVVDTMIVEVNINMVDTTIGVDEMDSVVTVVAVIMVDVIQLHHCIPTCKTPNLPNQTRSLHAIIVANLDIMHVTVMLNNVTWQHTILTQNHRVVLCLQQLTHRHLVHLQTYLIQKTDLGADWHIQVKH